MEDLIEEMKSYESPADFRNKWRHDYPEEMIGTASSIFDQVAEALSARKTAKK